MSFTLKKKVPGVVRSQTRADTLHLSWPNGLTAVKKPLSVHTKTQETKKEHESDQVPKNEAILSTENTKLKKFRALLLNPNLDIDVLRNLSWSGIPDDVRATTWKILLGYLPTNLDRQAQTLVRKRQEYTDCVPQYLNAPLDDNYERSLYRQISIDVPRTNPSCSLFQNSIIQKSLIRILYVWSIRHPASGYVQGINDLVTPFFIVFLTVHTGPDFEHYDIESIPESVLTSIEADSYWCMSKLLDGIQDNYTFAQPGIQRMVFKLKELIYTIDAPLAKHLDQQDAQFIQFAFRWMNCLLMREIPLRLIIRMWDTYLSEANGFAAFHVYVCAAFLKRWSLDLVRMDFQEIMLFLQHLPTVDWTEKEVELILSEAYQLKCYYHDAPSHLRTSNSGLV